MAQMTEEDWNEFLSNGNYDKEEYSRLTTISSAISRFYPVHIVQDRYSGTYSNGKWVAIADYDERNFDESGDPFGCDGEAGEFWLNGPTPDWIAVGNTPNEALINLYKKNKVDLEPGFDWKWLGVGE